MKKGEHYKKYNKSKSGIIRFRATDEDYENLWTLQRELGLDMSATIRVALSITCEKLNEQLKK